MSRNARLFLLVVAGLFIFLFLFQRPLSFGGAPKQLDYSQFVQEIQSRNVTSGTLERDQFSGELRNGNKFYVTLPPSDQARSELIKNLTDYGVQFKVSDSRMPEYIQQVVFMFLAMLLVIGVFWLFLARTAQAGSNQAFSFGKARARRYNESVPKVTFSDVAGVEEAKQELAEVVDYLKNTKKYQALGAKIPKGVLLLGPPGCGKTLLARAVAGEAGVPFFHISGSDFVEMFVGVGAARVRDLFENAKANRPALIFIDEIDAVGRLRGAGLGGGHDEREQTLNQLLVEMDGFDPNLGIIIIAATNRPDVLDPALLRPGRFDRHIVVDPPDAQGREQILDVHMRGKPLSANVDAGVIAKRTPGFTGADLANLVNEAALLAARRDKNKVNMDDFEEAIDRVIAGPQRRNRVMDKREREVIAYHEVGHAIVGEKVPNGDPVHKISILPRGMALGYTVHMPERDRYLYSKGNLQDRITTLLGGRVAEELVFGDVGTGAQDDLKRATEMARSMVCEYGMSEKLGPLTFGRRHGSPFLGRDLMEDRNYSEQVAYEIDQEVRAIIDHSYQRAREILLENREKMDQVVQVLLEKESLSREEFISLMEGEVQPGELPPASPALPEPDSEGESKKPSSPRLKPKPATS